MAAPILRDNKKILMSYDLGVGGDWSKLSRVTKTPLSRLSLYYIPSRVALSQGIKEKEQNERVIKILRM